MTRKVYHCSKCRKPLKIEFLIIRGRWGKPVGYCPICRKKKRR